MQFHLPQFPLSIVVFPGEKLPLHIFESRYQQLVRDCISEDKTFGITPVINQNLKALGTEVKLLDVHKEYEDGQMDIVVQGIEIYEILDFQKVAPDRLYGIAEVVRKSASGVFDPVMSDQIRDLVNKLFDLMQIKTKEVPPSSDPFYLGHKIGLSLEEEFLLLTMTKAKERQKMVLDKLLQILPKVYELESIRNKIEMNGHFRYLKPPNF